MTDPAASTGYRFFLSATDTLPQGCAREAVMDANPWKCAVTAEEIAREGARARPSPCRSRRRAILPDLVAGAPDRVLAVALDVTLTDQLAAAVGAALDRFGRIDVLVNNAGHGSVGAVEEIVLDDLRELMDTMFLRPVARTQAVLPHMRERGSARSCR